LSQLGQADAQRQLYETCYSQVFRLAARMTNHDAADEVVQQVFLLAFRNIKQFAGDSRFQTWLYRVTVNEALQFLRRERRHRSLPLPEQYMDQSPLFDNAAENRELLEQALQQIDPELRAIFLLREVEQLSYDEIAKVLNIAVGTVGSRLNRARSVLREALLELGWEA
jgi:RNA polymerase sigma-70 factor (ECF subfamily)